MIKKGSHLEGVEPINEKAINKDELLKIIASKIGYNKYYTYLEKIIRKSDVYDKSGYSGNSVLICKNKKTSYVIKLSKTGKLINEYISCRYFYKKGLTSKPVKYFKINNYEVMITEYISLPTAGFYFNSFKDIAVYFGKELKKYHDLNLMSSTFTIREKRLFSKLYDNNLKKALENDVGLIYMTMYLDDEDICKMKKYLIDNKNMLHKNEVLVHGDFNPNNVFIDENKNIKLIDFCDSGFCNKHYDIFWTMFMIIIFSGILTDKEKTKECEKIFLEAYGLEYIDEKELQYFKYYSCLHWKRHDEITRIDIL